MRARVSARHARAIGRGAIGTSSGGRLSILERAATSDERCKQLLHGGRSFNLPFRTRCPDGCAGPRSLGRPLAGRADEMVGGDLIVNLAALIDARSHTNAEIPGYSRPGPRDHAARSKKSGPIA